MAHGAAALPTVCSHITHSAVGCALTAAARYLCTATMAKWRPHPAAASLARAGTANRAAHVPCARLAKRTWMRTRQHRVPTAQRECSPTGLVPPNASAALQDRTLYLVRPAAPAAVLVQQIVTSIPLHHVGSVLLGAFRLLQPQPSVLGSVPLALTLQPARL